MAPGVRTAGAKNRVIPGDQNFIPSARPITCRVGSCAPHNWNGSRRLCARAYDHVKLFRQRMDERGVKPRWTSHARRHPQLPFTMKTDLRDTYPFGLFASPCEDVVRLHASSGTTGKPIVVGLHAEDLAVWTNVMVRAVRRLRAACAATSCRTPTATGCSPADWARITAPKRWGDGDSDFRRQHRPADYGAEGFRGHGHLLHAELFPAPDRPGRASWASDCANCRCASGSSAPSRGRNPCAPHRNRGRHQGLRHLRPLGNHRSRRGGGMRCQNGLHIFEDHFYPEVIDPETAEPMPDGERANWC
jgi:phenylacetate-CoA ligase